MKQHPEKIDCIEMKDRIQSEIYEQIKDLTPEEEIEFFRKGASQGPLGDFYRSLLGAPSKTRSKRG